MVSADQITESKAVQRSTGATFHLATRVLPERIRRPTYVLYAFFRVGDEVVDDPDPPPADDQRRELERLRAVALGDRDPEEPIPAAFAALRDEYGIPDREVHAFVDAMRMDVDAADFETEADLSEYLRGSSVAVANMLLAVMEPDELEASRPHARALAEAFQLTNFVRDVREDVVDYDRVYLPREWLAEHDLEPDDVRALVRGDGTLDSDDDSAAALRAAVADAVERTEDRYREGVAGIRYLPADCQFGVLLAATLYAEHHRLIAARDFDVVSGRPSLSLPRRLLVLARTWWHWRRTGDPEATFFAVSPVGRSEDGRPGTAAAGRSDGPLARLRRALSGASHPGLGGVRRVVSWGED